MAFPVLDNFTGSASSDLSAHVSDSHSGWSYDPTTPSASILLDGLGGVAAPGPMTSLAVAGDAPSAECVASLTVRRGTAAGRMGPVCRLTGGVGLWGFLDAQAGLWGLARLSAGSASVLATRPSGVTLGASTALTVWSSGRQVSLAADGKIVLMGVTDLPVPVGSVGLCADGSASGCVGSLFSAGYPRAAGDGVYAGGNPSDLIGYLSHAAAAWGLTSPCAAFTSIEPEPYPYCGLPMVVIRPGQAPVDEAMNAGLGRFYNNETFQFGLTLVGMRASDQAGRDDLGMAGGVSVLAASVFNRFHMTFPRSPTGDYLTREPLALAGGASPGRVYRKVRSWRAADLGGRVPLAAGLTAMD